MELVRCDFETNFCGMVQRSGDNGNWARDSGLTSSSGSTQDTGPNGASSGTFFIYFEVSGPVPSGHRVMWVIPKIFIDIGYSQFVITNHPHCITLIDVETGGRDGLGGGGTPTHNHIIILYMQCSSPFFSITPLSPLENCFLQHCTIHYGTCFMFFKWRVYRTGFFLLPYEKMFPNLWYWN